MSKRINLGLHSWRAFIARAAERVSQSAFDGGESASLSKGRDRGEWAGTATLDEALVLATKGWQEGAQAVGRTLDNVTPAQDVLPDWQLEVAGSFPVMAACMAGSPESFFLQTDNAKQARRLVLAVPGTYHCGVSADEAANYAKAVAATCRAIEATGIDVAIYSIDVTGGYGGNTVYGTTVREFGEPLDLAKVAFAFHPSWLRRIGFAWRERTKEACKAGIAACGYGYPKGVSPEDARELIGEASQEVALCVLPTVGDLHDARALRGGDETVRKLIADFRAKVDEQVKAQGGERS